MQTKLYFFGLVEFFQVEEQSRDVDTRSTYQVFATPKSPNQDTMFIPCHLVK